MRGYYVFHYLGSWVWGGNVQHRNLIVGFSGTAQVVEHSPGMTLNISWVNIGQLGDTFYFYLRERTKASGHASWNILVVRNSERQ